MNQETEKLVDNFLQECKSVDIFDYTLGVFIVHLNHNIGNFHYEFKKFNEANGIRFEYIILPHGKVAISER
jgi:uncharacterized protein (DUF4213/DUF364 family)